MEAVSDAIGALREAMADPWGDVDRCLAWLRERGYVTYGPNEPGAWVQVKVAGVWLPHVNAPTLHAAMVAVCRAVGEETP